jgi:hypothetical protein
VTLQFIGGKSGGVDYHVRPPPQRVHHLALGGDARRGRQVRRQRMAPPRLIVTPLQFLARAIEIERRQFDIVAQAQPLDQLHDRVRIEPARARIEADRQRRVLQFVGIGRIDQPFEQANRKIVDHLPAQVLQHAQRGGLARAQHAGHQQHPLADGRRRRRDGFGVGWRGHQPLLCSAITKKESD